MSRTEQMEADDLERVSGDLPVGSDVPQLIRFRTDIRIALERVMMKYVRVGPERESAQESVLQLVDQFIKDMGEKLKAPSIHPSLPPVLARLNITHSSKLLGLLEKGSNAAKLQTEVAQVLECSPNDVLPLVSDLKNSTPICPSS